MEKEEATECKTVSEPSPEAVIKICRCIWTHDEARIIPENEIRGRGYTCTSSTFVTAVLRDGELNIKLDSEGISINKTMYITYKTNTGELGTYDVYFNQQVKTLTFVKID